MTLSRKTGRDGERPTRRRLSTPDGVELRDLRLRTRPIELLLDRPGDPALNLARRVAAIARALSLASGVPIHRGITQSRHPEP